MKGERDWWEREIIERENGGRERKHRGRERMEGEKERREVETLVLEKQSEMGTKKVIKNENEITNS
jgi:hypothetical protein